MRTTMEFWLGIKRRSKLLDEDLKQIVGAGKPEDGGKVVVRWWMLYIEE